MAKVGRNDRCPCESGKKYKQCHAIAEGNAMADSDRAMRLHELDRAIVERLLRFATLERGEEWLFELVDGLEIDPEEIEHHEGRVPARERVDVSSVWSELGLRDAGMRS